MSATELAPDLSLHATLPTDLPLGLMLNGKVIPASNGAVFAVRDPANNRVLAEVADATPKDAMAALDAAAAAQSTWAATPARARGEILRSAFDMIVARREEFAQLMTLEMGKTIADARGEVDYGAEFLRWFSEEAVRITGDYRPAPDNGSYVLVSRQPVGPALMITPWNFPLAMATRKLGAAFAAGCTAIVKPAQQTPLTTLLVAKIFNDAGLPPGVLNVVTTSKASAATGPLIDDPRLRKLSFTGSTEVGSALMARATKHIQRVSMELGGNAPFVVLEGADVDRAVGDAMIAKLRNVGQACVAANRFLVHASIAEEFSTKLAQRFSTLRLGHGLDPTTDVGPLIDKAGVDKVDELVSDAVERGAKVLAGGRRSPLGDHFYEATVLTDLDRSARCLHEEIFGPVAPIIAFDTEDEAVAMANDTPFGLAAYLQTPSLDESLRVCARLEAGMIGLNRGMLSNAAAPFGGIKLSGIGREGGFEGVSEYLDTKYVAIDRRLT
jgi:succinate-semialdehyde dehydrogenase / glutarate-semialdehyde dehydrogenase